MRIVTTSIMAAICLLISYPAGAGNRGSCTAPSCGTPSCCAQCGGHRACQQRTRQVVCEIKEVKRVCWSVECESFQPLRPAGLARTGGSCGSSCGDVNCGSSCGTSCGPGGCASRGQNKCVTCCEPGKARCKKKLMKREITVKVPVYKCEVQYLCSGCCTSGCGVEVGEAAAPSAAPVAPAPAPISKEARQTLLVPMPSY